MSLSGGVIDPAYECKRCIDVPSSIQLRRSQSPLVNHPSHWTLQRRYSLDQSVAAINAIPGVNFHFTVASTTNVGVGYADPARAWNGVSEVRFRSPWDAGDSKGRTLLDGRRVMYDPVVGGWVCQFQGVDVELDYAWDQNGVSYDHLLYSGHLVVPGTQQPLTWGAYTDNSAYFYLKTPLIPLMAHELGHALGLHHPPASNQDSLTSGIRPLQSTLPQGGLGSAAAGPTATAGERDWALLLGNHGATFASERAVLISLFAPPSSLTGLSNRQWDEPESYDASQDSQIQPAPPPAYFSAMPSYPSFTISGRVRFEVRCSNCSQPVIVPLRQANSNGAGTPVTLSGTDLVPTPISVTDLGGGWDLTQALRDYAVTPGDGLARYQLCVVWTGTSPSTSYTWATTACGHPEMIVP